MRIVILSDIHANVTAFKAVLADISSIGKVDALAIIGDLVNYGPRPNEIIEMVNGLDKPLLVNLWGNHEYSIFGGSLERFATVYQTPITWTKKSNWLSYSRIINWG